MQAIQGAVGDGAANAVSDVALVQAILVKTRRTARPAQPAGPYLISYDGTFGAGTSAAIRAFQADHVSGPAAGRVTPGTVGPGDATWQALIANVPDAFRDLRVLIGHRTVYVQATAAQLQAKLDRAATCTFTDAFRVKVNTIIRRMHADHGIAVGVDRQGDRRDFQTQYDLRTSGRGVTGAGPGESNHNFGGAVDLGFSGLRWLRSTGAVVEDEGDWLDKIHATSTTEEGHFWDALRAAGIACGAFRGPLRDRPHLQNWNDAGVSMSARLADLLTRSGTMRWSGQRGVYSSDLGLGGALVSVGTAVQIWNDSATVDAATIDRLRAAAPRRPGQTAARPGGGGRATAADVVAMRRALHQQFVLADQNWRNWTDR